MSPGCRPSQSTARPERICADALPACCCLRIGPLTLSLRAADGCRLRVPGTDPHDAFLDRSATDSEAGIPVIVSQGESPPPGLAGMTRQAPCFRHRAGWHLYREPAAKETTYWAALPIPPGTENWQRILRIRKDQVDLHIPDGAERSDEPLAYLVTELLYLVFLQWQAGLLLHGAGVALGGQALLLVGPSGSGKSTLASLWTQTEPGAVLGDESLVVWPETGRVFVSGTPWPGTSGVYANRQASVCGVCFLAHGPENRLRPLSREEAATRLLINTFMPHWQAEPIARVLDLAERMTGGERRRAWSFCFQPDARAVAALLPLLESAGES